MKFTFEGREYRIGFAHEKSRDWSAHTGHEVALESPGLGKPVALHCIDCDLQLSHLSKADRVRRTRCMIVRDSGEVDCPDGRWEPVAGGDSRPNVKAGDRYTREGGRKAALANALNGCGKEFRAAAWKAYHARTRKQAEIHATRGILGDQPFL